jgi:hypothetical protein
MLHNFPGMMVPLLPGWHWSLSGWLSRPKRGLPKSCFFRKCSSKSFCCMIQKSRFFPTFFCANSLFLDSCFVEPGCYWRDVVFVFSFVIPPGNVTDRFQMMLLNFMSLPPPLPALEAWHWRLSCSGNTLLQSVSWARQTISRGAVRKIKLESFFRSCFKSSCCMIQKSRFPPKALNFLFADLLFELSPFKLNSLSVLK